MWDTQSVESAQDTLQFYIVVVIIPTIAVVLLSSHWQDLRSAKLFSVFGLIGSLILILASILGFSEWRSTTINSGGRFSYDVLDPITVGNLGAATAIAGFCVYRATRSPWALASVALGVVCLAMGLSRGPILSLLGCVVVYLWLTGRTWCLFVSLIPTIALFFTEFGGAIISSLRLGSIQTDVTANIRLNVIMSSISQFMESPLVGSGHVEEMSGNYPHNLFIDAAISTGLIGLFIVVFVFIKSWLIGIQRARSGNLFLFLILVYWMIEVQFSGAIWSNVMLWLSMALVLSSRSLVKISASQRIDQLRFKPSVTAHGAVIS